ncbi:hypothetical protein I3843_01G242500 [Carya illinoinensis]|nr:hypothetical protein I3843_01G242500 [Carya illinoinensis]
MIAFKNVIMSIPSLGNFMEVGLQPPFSRFLYDTSTENFEFLPRNPSSLGPVSPSSAQRHRRRRLSPQRHRATLLHTRKRSHCVEIIERSKQLECEDPRPSPPSLIIRRMVLVKQ